jgi:hypothetical protein
MTRPSVTLAALLLTVTGNALPDAMPTRPQSGFTPAPVPNQDIVTPGRIDSGGPSVSADLQSKRIILRSGDGFTPGSNFSDELERRSRGAASGLAPTLNFNFPLQK